MERRVTGNKTKRAERIEIFAREYVVDLNGTRAAIAAGYSPKGADVASSRLLGNGRVQELLAKLTAKRMEKLNITADKVLLELARLAFLDPRRFFNNDGSLKNITDLDDDTAAAVAGMDMEEKELYSGTGDERTSIGKIRTKKMKLADKGANLERLGRYLKLFTDKVEHSGEVQVSVLDRLLAARKRVSEA